MLEALDRGSELGKELRQYWQGLKKQLRVNREALKVLREMAGEERHI